MSMPASSPKYHGNNSQQSLVETSSSILGCFSSSVESLPPASQNSDATSSQSDILQYVDSLYSFLEVKTPGFAECGCQEWVDFMQVDYHRVSFDNVVSSWLRNLHLGSDSLLSAKASSTLFLKSIDLMKTKLSALLLQIYRDAPGSFWRPFETTLETMPIFSFIYLFCFSCLIGALEYRLSNFKLFLKSLSEYFISEDVIRKYEVEFRFLLEKILEQRQSRIKSLISQSLIRHPAANSTNLLLLNEYYMVSMESRQNDNSCSSINLSLRKIEAWRPSAMDLMVVVEEYSRRPITTKDASKKKWLKLISVPMVTAALLFFSQLLKNGFFSGRRLM